MSNVRLVLLSTLGILHTTLHNVLQPQMHPPKCWSNVHRGCWANAASDKFTHQQQHHTLSPAGTTVYHSRRCHPGTTNGGRSMHVVWCLLRPFYRTGTPSVANNVTQGVCS